MSQTRAPREPGDQASGLPPALPQHCFLSQEILRGRTAASSGLALVGRWKLNAVAVAVVIPCAVLDIFLDMAQVVDAAGTSPTIVRLTPILLAPAGDFGGVLALTDVGAVLDVVDVFELHRVVADVAVVSRYLMAIVSTPTTAADADALPPDRNMAAIP